MLVIQIQATLKGKTLPNYGVWNFICMTCLGMFDSPGQPDESQNESKQYSRPMRLGGQIKDHVDAILNTPNSSSQWIFSRPSWVENALGFTLQHLGCSVTDSPPSSTTRGFNIILELASNKMTRAGGEKTRGTAEMTRSYWTPSS